MIFVARPQLNIPLYTVKSKDDIVDLVNAYNQNRKKLAGKTVSDIAHVAEELHAWQDVDIIDRLIPFKFRKQSNEPLGHRMWYLSQKKGTKYYAGWFFDYKVSITGIRKIRKRYRLTKNALILFEDYPEIKENKEIHLT